MNRIRKGICFAPIIQSNGYSSKNCSYFGIGLLLRKEIVQNSYMEGGSATEFTVQMYEFQVKKSLDFSFR